MPKRVLTESYNLEALYPDVVKEWHPTKNGDLNPSDFYPSSHKKVWWKCQKEHDFFQPIDKRTLRKSGCKYCAGKDVHVKTSLAYNYPEISKEWHPTKNGSLTPKDVTCGSNKKVWWKCEKGPDHEWQSHVVGRTKRNRGCRFCAHKSPSINYNLGIINPKLAKQWHPTLNGDMTPFDILPFSHKKYWWLCDKNHPFQSAEMGRKTGVSGGCTVCSGKTVIRETSLLFLYPDIANEWDYGKNKMGPGEVTANSSRRIFWKCDKGPDHTWHTTPASRVTRGRACPCCAGKQVSVTNSLATLFPDISEEWHPKRNGKLKPSDFTSGSNKKIWWECSRNPKHEWPTTIVSRTMGGTGCGICTHSRSEIEISIAHELKTVFSFDISKTGVTTKSGPKKQVDVFIPEQRIIVEFDAHYWHKDRYSIDSNKTRELTEDGYKVIRIREKPLEKISPDDLLVDELFSGSAVHDPALLKPVMNQLLDKISESVKGFEEPIARYKSSETLLNLEEAQRFLEVRYKNNRQLRLSGV